MFWVQSSEQIKVSGVSSKKVRAGLKPDTRHLKPILRKGFNTPDNVQKKRAIFTVNFEVCNYKSRGGIMSLIKSIRQFLKEKKVPDDSIDKVVPKEEPVANAQNGRTETPAESEVGIEFLDGMSTGTARFIIDRKVTGDVLKKYEIKDLENKGRYYLAKIVDPDGSVTDTVLIDKMNRTVHFEKGKFQ
jgi:hypothetical protein